MKTTYTPPTPVATGDNTTAAARPWPGTREWNDDDYKQFVQLFSQGAFPGLRDDPTAWDQHIIPADSAGNSPRPTLISHHDFHHHLPEPYRDRYGFLVVNLWEIARAKGYTKTFEQQAAEAARQQAGEEQQLLRDEIKNLEANLPAPEPRPLVDLRQQWYKQTLAPAPPGAKLIEKAKLVQQAVIDGQPFRNCLLTEDAVKLVEDNFGPLMFDQSHDAMEHPIEPDEEEEPEPILKKWHPDATPAQIVKGAARELADLVALLIARQKVAVGFIADTKTIQEVRQLTRSLNDLDRIIGAPPRRKRGRPRKPRFVKPELLGENPENVADF